MASIDLSSYGVTYGANQANVSNNDGALAACAMWFAAQVAAGNPLPKLTSHEGIVCYSQSPNWAIPGLFFEAVGDVHLRYFGTGDAVTIDGGATSPQKTSNVNFGGAGNFILEAPGTAQNACYARALLRSSINIRVYGAGAQSAGLLTSWLVDCDINAVVTPDETGGWYMNAQPLAGVSLGARKSNEQTSYCRIKASVDGCTIGAYLSGTLGNHFEGGYIEGCSGYGMQLLSGALNDKVRDMDFETNGTDITCDGQYTTLEDIDTSSHVVFTSNSVAGRLVGGNHDAVTVNLGAKGTAVDRIRYGRALSGNGITNLDPSSDIGVNYNCLTKKWSDQCLPTNAISVGASPFIYTSALPRGETLLVTTPASLTGIVLYRNGAAVENFPPTQPMFLSYGDTAVFSFTGGAPTVVSLPR